MTISIITAWISVFFSLLLAMKFIGRISGNRKANRFLHNIHIPLGVVLIISALLHGVFAGNCPGATVSDFTPAPMLLTLNAGTLCFVLILLLALSYVFRKKLGGKWMSMHRGLTIAMVTALVCHLMAVGITADDFLFTSPTFPEEPEAIISVAEPAPSEVLLPSDELESMPEIEESISEAPQSSFSDSSQPELPPEDSIVKESVLPEEPPAPLVTFSGAVLADGVYTGSAQGYKDIIEVEVTVLDGAVTDLAILSHRDTPDFFDYALYVVDSILGAQSLDVDAVSGATYSSAGIMTATYNALQDAVMEGELVIREIQFSGRGHHRH